MFNILGIFIYMMLEGCSDDFKKYFCGIYFFNLFCYMCLLEIIFILEMDFEVVDFFMYYGDVYLGKQIVFCKDMFVFIVNCVGVYVMVKIY